MRIHWLRVAYLVLGLVAFVIFIHGANQVGVMNGPFTNPDSWNDESNGLPFMVMGAFFVLGLLGLVILAEVRRLRRAIERR